MQDKLASSRVQRMAALATTCCGTMAQDARCLKGDSSENDLGERDMSEKLSERGSVGSCFMGLPPAPKKLPKDIGGNCVPPTVSSVLAGLRAGALEQALRGEPLRRSELRVLVRGRLSLLRSCTLMGGAGVSTGAGRDRMEFKGELCRACGDELPPPPYSRLPVQVPKDVLVISVTESCVAIRDSPPASLGRPRSLTLPTSLAPMRNVEKEQTVVSRVLARSSELRPRVPGEMGEGSSWLSPPSGVSARAPSRFSICSLEKGLCFAMLFTRFLKVVAPPTLFFETDMSNSCTCQPSAT